MKKTSTATSTHDVTSEPVFDLASLKTEAAVALGLWDKVRREGWGALTAAESGSIGGYVSRMRLMAKRQAELSN
ncbi:MAG: hypothetical protein C7B45_15665 [Sulfobacillus acidophilus]|uniref:Small, acid-soluble spore protein, alpha/beta type n=1 Tax=Sulfobacillus acidophilus TaxID=53633 RepID=A0A2T2WDI5_9FIRM|nr:MAG: hypothetical protein C7B45_15665 [Sulfobacillus acidophilus]